MLATNAETPAHRVDDDGRQNFELLGGVLGTSNTAHSRTAQRVSRRFGVSIEVASLLLALAGVGPREVRQ
jgi:hypothetical protein